MNLFYYKYGLYHRCNNQYFEDHFSSILTINLKCPEPDCKLSTYSSKEELEILLLACPKIYNDKCGWIYTAGFFGFPSFSKTFIPHNKNHKDFFENRILIK